MLFILSFLVQNIKFLQGNNCLKISCELWPKIVIIDVLFETIPNFRPPANTGIGGGNIIEIVFALLTFEEICVFWVDTMFRLILLSLLLLLFWLLLIFATTLLTAANTDIIVHTNTICEIPVTADSAMGKKDLVQSVKSLLIPIFLGFFSKKNCQHCGFWARIALKWKVW